MVAIQPEWFQSREEHIAQLTEVAYHAILQRGYRGSFLDLELALWRAIQMAFANQPEILSQHARNAS